MLYNRRDGLEGELSENKFQNQKACFGARTKGNQSAFDALSSLTYKAASLPFWCPCLIRVRAPPLGPSMSWSDPGPPTSDEHSSDSTSCKLANPTPESPDRFKTTS